MSTEEWRPVAGYEGLYEVSTSGQVRSLWFGRPRLLKANVGNRGYRLVSLSGRGGKRKHLVHRLVAVAFVGRQPSMLHEVRHIDGDPLNNAAPNLAWGTSSDNNLDQVRHGTHRWSSRTHCESGHAYTPENTKIEYSRGRPFRRCRICLRRVRAQNLRRRYHRRKQAA